MSDPQIIDIAGILLPELSRPWRFGIAFAGISAFFTGAWILQGLIGDIRENGLDGGWMVAAHGAVTFPAVLFWMASSATLLAWAVL